MTSQETMRDDCNDSVVAEASNNLSQKRADKDRKTVQQLLVSCTTCMTCMPDDDSVRILLENKPPLAPAEIEEGVELNELDPLNKPYVFNRN